VSTPADTRIVWVEDPASLPDAWDDAVGPLDYHLSREWLAYTHQSSSRFGATLLAADDAGEPLSGLTVHELDASSGPNVRIDTALDDHHATRLLERDPALAGTLARELLPTLACGGRSIGRSRVVGLRGATDADTARTLLASAVDLAATRGDASVSVLFADEEDVVLCDTLEELGFVEVGCRHALSLECPWTSFEDYLASRSSSRRGSIRRERRRVEEAGWVVEQRPLDEDLARVMARLTCINEHKYGNEVDEEAQLEYFDRLLQLLPGRVEALVARADSGEIGGGLTILRWRQVIVAREFGVDPRLAQDVPLYFELVFYAPIELAARTGARYIDYSVGLEDVKRSRGCGVTPRRGFVKCLDERTQARLRMALRE
jgi:hypothetical protein